MVISISALQLPLQGNTVMNFNSETPTTNMTVQGEIFKIAQPFSEGHACLKNEAASLNQSLVENARNNFAKLVKQAKEDDTFDQAKMQAELDAYMETYEFGARGGRSALDPITKAAMEIAKNIVKNALREQNFKIADVDPADITRLAEDVIVENPDIRKAAKKQVDERAKIGATVDLSKIAPAE